jgi:hypothetical protein
VFALLAMGTAVTKRFQAFIAPATCVRVLLAATAAFFAARLFPGGSKLASPLALVAGGVTYVIALFVVRELGKKDLEAVLRIVRR